MPLGVMAYMAYAGWTVNDVAVDFTGGLVFKRRKQAAAATDDLPFPDDEEEPGALKWVKLEPLKPPPSFRIPLNERGQFALSFYGPRYKFPFYSDWFPFLR